MINIKTYTLLIIVLISIIIYSNSFDCSFHFDDSIDIVNNPTIREITNVKAWWNYSVTRPVSMFTFALNYHFHEDSVFGYHLVNLIIHIINACLVWWLIILTLSSPAFKNDSIVKHKLILAFFGAVIFASHPVQTQAVTYIVQRMTSLATMFYLLSLTLYIKARIRPNKKSIMFITSACSAVLAMLTKQIAFTLPFIIILYEFIFFKPENKKINFKDKRVIITLVILLLLIIIIPAMMSFNFSLIFREITSQQGNIFTLTGTNYLLTQFRVITTYIRLLFLPINQNLDYDYPISTTLFSVNTFLSFLFLLIIIAIAFLLFKKYKIIAFGIFWFFITLSVESSIIPIPNVIFEHRIYLPSVGFIFFLISAIYYLLWHVNYKIVISIFILITSINSILTYKRNEIWKNEYTLWTDVISKSPNKARPWNNRGFFLGTKGKYDQALDDFNKAISINPRYIKALTNRGALYMAQQKYSKAFVDMNKAIEIAPYNLAVTYLNRGMLYMIQKNFEKSIMDLQIAIELDPLYAKAYYSLGNTYSFQKLNEKAIMNYSKAININKRYAQAYNNRGVVYLNIKNYKNSVLDFTHAIKLQSNYADAYYNRGKLYFDINKFKKAILDFSNTIKINENHKKAFYNRGLCFYVLKKYNLALKDFLRAKSLGFKIPEKILEEVSNFIKKTI